MEGVHSRKVEEEEEFWNLEHHLIGSDIDKSLLCGFFRVCSSWAMATIAFFISSISLIGICMWSGLVSGLGWRCLLVIEFRHLECCASELLQGGGGGGSRLLWTEVSGSFWAFWFWFSWSRPMFLVLTAMVYVTCKTERNTCFGVSDLAS